VRIALFGSDGQLGRAFRDLLEPRPGYELLPPPDLDLTDHSALTNYLRGAKPDLIINCAAYTAVDRAEQEPELCDAVNHLAVAALAEEARELGALLVHFSTDYVFSGHAPVPYREDDPTGPLNVYGRSKLAGEHALRATEGLAYLLLRTSWLYGPIGRNFVLGMAARLGRGETVTVVDDQLGTPTTTRQVADLTLALLERGERGLYHLAGEGVTSWFGLTSAVAEELSRQDQVRSCPSNAFRLPAQRPANSALSTAKLTALLGRSPGHWREQLRGVLTAASLLLLVLVFTNCAGTKKEQVEDPDILTRVAEDYIRKNENLRALQALSQAEQLTPDDVRVAKLAGIAHLARGQYATSETYLLRALALTDEPSEIHLLLSHLYLVLGRWEQVISQCEEALRDPLTPFPHIAYNNMGWAYHQLGDHVRAVENLRIAVANRAGYVLALHNLGLVYLKLKRYALAGNAFVKALRACQQCEAPVQSELYQRLASAFSLIGNTEKALEYYRRCHDLAPAAPPGKECARMAVLLDPTFQPAKSQP